MPVLARFFFKNPEKVKSNLRHCFQVSKRSTPIPIVLFILECGQLTVGYQLITRKAGVQWRAELPGSLYLYELAKLWETANTSSTWSSLK